MEKISNYISKKVISLDEGENIGYIINVLFSDELSSLIGYIVVDEESDRLFIIDRADCKAVGDDCIIISSSSDLKVFLEEESNNPISKQVYDTSGLYLGRVIDVMVESGKVKRIITTKCEFFRKNIRKIGKNYLIYGNKERKKLGKADVFKVETDNLPIVNLQKNEVQTKPYRLLANQNSLLGRTMTNDLYGYNNEIIAKKYDIINQNIINKAKLHNKLNFLIYYSK